MRHWSTTPTDGPSMEWRFVNFLDQSRDRIIYIIRSTSFPNEMMDMQYDPPTHILSIDAPLLFHS